MRVEEDDLHELLKSKHYMNAINFVNKDNQVQSNCDQNNTKATPSKLLEPN